MLLGDIASPPLNMKGRLWLSMADGLVGGVDKKRGKIVLKALRRNQSESFGQGRMTGSDLRCMKVEASK